MAKKKVEEPIDENPEDIEEPTTSEKQQIGSIADRLHNVVNMLEDKTKYTSLLELFKLVNLKIITELDKKKVESITKFETYAESQKLLYGLKDDDDGIIIINKMCDAFRINMISHNRKSRKELVEILKEAQETFERSRGDRLLGRR